MANYAQQVIGAMRVEEELKEEKLVEILRSQSIIKY